MASNSSKLILICFASFLIVGWSLNAFAQQGCPQWAQQKKVEIIQEYLQDIQSGQPLQRIISNLQSRIQNLPPACLNNPSSSFPGIQGGGSSMQMDPSILKGGGTIIAPNAAGCDGTGCVAFEE